MRSRLLFSIVGCAMLAIGCAQSDAGITTSVKSQLAADDIVKARRIDVDTRERVVTLTGEVRTAEEEARALQIARNTNGVANVVDELSIVAEPQAAPTTGVGGTPTEPGGGALTNDASITSAVKSKLLADPDTSGLRIDVDTKDSMVTLTGTVRTETEKDQALAIARNTEGVKNVTNRLNVERRQ
jgi:hyperosmotically inducible periplasmic protein